MDRYQVGWIVWIDWDTSGDIKKLRYEMGNDQNVSNMSTRTAVGGR